MPILILLLILLAFPIAEIWILVELFDRYGWPVLGYLILVGVLGWRLVREERQQISSKFAQGLSTGLDPSRLLIGSARNIFAGILLMVPGIISDAIAVLLLLPSARPAGNNRFSAEPETDHRHERRGADSCPDIIEGEFRRED
ncbi:MAG TPA: FxsA family protein [Methylophilaceae bacterium]|jgi:UPF0716 protein FxsA